MNREEYNPFIHNAWMMMGRSQYNNGDFLGAGSTFYYISKHFTWLPDVTTESLLWQARSYCSLGWRFEAENILILIKPDQLTNKTLKSLYHITYTDYLIKGESYEEAIPHLENAKKSDAANFTARVDELMEQIK